MSPSGILQIDVKSPVGKSVVFYGFSCKRNVQPQSMSDSPSVFRGACNGTRVAARRNAPAKRRCWGETK